jgi:CDP-4-dehydro-6-deoxyglucose reductase
MTYIVQIKPSGNLLFVEPGHTVLQTALKAGYEFPYSCGSATCGSCMGKVLNGAFTYGHVQPYALDEAAQEDGFALFCSVQPTSDMVIEVEDVYAPGFIPARKAEYQVENHTKLTDDIYQVTLTPKKKPLNYHAGQYMKIIADDGIPVPFSIASLPKDDGVVELQIKTINDNVYSKEFIEKIVAKKNLLLRGPYGNVRYYGELDLPIIFMAGGTGIVPIKALIEKALSHDKPQELYLFWGGRKRADLYLFEHMQALADQHPRFHFIPVLSGTEEYWQGETGLVHEVIAKQHDNMSGHQVYASGPSEMVYQALDAFTAKGLKPQLMFSDTFEVYPRD